MYSCEGGELLNDGKLLLNRVSVSLFLHRFEAKRLMITQFNGTLDGGIRWDMAKSTGMGKVKIRTTAYLKT